MIKWCPHTDSNRGPIDYKLAALEITYLSMRGIHYENIAYFELYKDLP